MSEFLISEDLGERYLLGSSSGSEIYAEGDFSWEAVRKPESKEEEKDGSEEKVSKAKSKSKTKTIGGDVTVLPSTFPIPTPPPVKEDEKPFELKSLRFTAPKGAFVAIVGRIGSGKASPLYLPVGDG
jgi:ABC-type multidrug transport system fused ATPase/permease subunit